MATMDYLQKVGKSLMVPVATLPAAAILMGIGYWLDPVSWGGDSVLAAFLINSGGALIDNMPLLFVLGVSFGLSKDSHGSAALSGLVMWLVLMALLSPDMISLIKNISVEEVDPAFGRVGNQFTGILVGIISATIYNRVSHIELPKFLAFFSGKRLVPILTSIAGMILAAVLMLLWPAIFGALTALGGKIQGLESIGVGIYGFLNRLTLTIGMHHALQSVFYFDVIGINDIPNFLGGAQSIANGDAIPGVTGRYQAGMFPVMMFGLPAAALAIYHCAEEQNKVKVASVMLAAALASFFTGITEPIEYSFMFLAPPLYVVHAAFTGLSMFISAQMGWMSGFGFSAGFVDFVLSSRNPLATQWYMLIVQGLFMATLYYFTFRFLITKFNFMTLGRGGKMDEDSEDLDDIELAKTYLAALGGKDNIIEVDHCITRLRLQIKDESLLNKQGLTTAGATGVIRLSETGYQVVVGPGKVDKVAAGLKSVLKV
ncbi:N-acetylglucosamine-specific PTS transporter subunit IIBC [Vibrio paucivorans]